MEKLQKYSLNLLMLFALFSCIKKDEATIISHKKRAMELFQKEFVDDDHKGPLQGSRESMQLLDEIIILDPSNCDALRELSVAYLKRGMPHEWKPRFDKAVACDPKIWQPWRGYLYLYFYRDYKKAIEDFNASDMLTPNFIDSPQGHSVDYWRGIAYLGLKDYENSIRYFEKHILKVSEDSGEDWVEPSAFLYLGIAHFENSELQEAGVNIKKALTYYQDISSDSHYYMSLVQMKDNQYDQALASIQKAIKNYNDGYYLKRDYVEEIRQIYPQQLEKLKNTILEVRLKEKKGK